MTLNILNLTVRRRKNTRVAVALSGGVDSSVAAALLVRQGYTVAGIFMKNFSAESWAGVLAADCPWERDQSDARGVCQTLGIPFYSVNFESEYRERVIEPFFQQYRNGATPNPDVWCNREIKFSLFWRHARVLGYPLMATGHYARVRAGRLFRGVDPRKDQSYFLCALSRRQLERVLFPLGELTKDEVRSLARRWHLVTADKPDSQGICFIGRVKLSEFLQQRIPPRAGLIRDRSGRVVGQHPGVWYYTIGQRQGLGIGGGTPYYVVEKNLLTNTLVVTDDPRGFELNRRQAKIRRMRWMGATPSAPFRCRVKIRTPQAEQPGLVRRVADRWVVDFDQPQFALARGQLAVFYRRGEVLGSGEISAAT